MAYLTIDAKDFGMVTVRKTKSSLIIASLREPKTALPVTVPPRKKAVADFKIKIPYSWVEDLIKSLMDWADDNSGDLTPREYLFPKKLGVKKPLLITKHEDAFTGWIPYKGEKKKFRISKKFLSSFIIAINTYKLESGETAA